MHNKDTKDNQNARVRNKGRTGETNSSKPRQLLNPLRYVPVGQETGSACHIIWHRNGRIREEKSGAKRTSEYL